MPSIRTPNRLASLGLLVCIALVNVKANSDVCLTPGDPGCMDGDEELSPLFPPGNEPAAPGIPKAFLFIGIMTARTNFARRESVRNSWSRSCKLSNDKPCLYKFFIGKAAGYEKPAHTDKLNKELKTHDDMVVLDLEDDYSNLVDKVVGVLDWGYTNVEFTYMAKIDDDVFFLPQPFSRLLNMYPTTGLYLGSKLSKSTPHRHPKHKYHTSARKYPMDELPPYIEGPAIVFSRDIVEYIATNKHVLKPFTHVDDPVIALWLLAIQVHPEHERSFMTGSASRGHNLGCTEDRTMIPNLPHTKVTQLWDAHQSGSSICAVLRG